MLTVVSKIEVTVAEIADCYQTHESLYDFLTEKVEEKMGRALNFFQMTDYEIVGYNGAMLHLQVEGYEEE